MLLCWTESMCTWEGRTPARLKRGRSPCLYHGTHRTAYGRHRTHGQTLGRVGPWGQCLQSERTRQARPSRFVPTLILYFPLSCGLAAWYWNRKDVE